MRDDSDVPNHQLRFERGGCPSSTAGGLIDILLGQCPEWREMMATRGLHFELHAVPFIDDTDFPTMVKLHTSLVSPSIH